MATAAAVAERLRQISGNRFTPLQLLKLVYIAHGWSFPIRKRGLIAERVEAWQYGPVIPSLYHTLKGFRAAPVTMPIQGSSVIPLAADETELVDKVYEVYGRYSGGQLSAMTHQPGTPWEAAWQRGKNSPIEDAMIASHYNRLHAERNGGRA